MNRTAALLSAILVGISTYAYAVDFQGVVQFQGNTVFPVAIPGVDHPDLTVLPDNETEATGNGEKCSILSTQSDNPDGTGAYPDAGDVNAEILLERGGPMNLPEGQCIVTVRASGSDGVSVSARGSQIVFVDAATIDGGGVFAVPDIQVRQSKAVAGIDKDCEKWVKKQLKLRAKCNFQLLKKGPDGALRCKDAGPEPSDCDPGNSVEVILAMSHGGNDQQTDPPNADLIDAVLLKDQINCQKRFGKAAANFAGKLAKLINRKCVLVGLDDESCRSQLIGNVRKKLDQLNKCTVDQDVDPDTLRAVPQIGAPCDVCISGGAYDAKCARGCFEVALVELVDNIVGDVPECGNGIQQPPEECDDGNTASGDCCSDSCELEVPGVEGPMGDPTCSDLQDNDCDGDVDGADTDCQ